MSMVKRDAAGPLPFHALFAIKYVQKKEDRDASVAATLSLLAARAPLLRASAPSLRLFLLLRLPLASPLLRRSLIYSPSEFFTAPTFTGSLCGPRPPQTNSYILPACFSDTMYYRTSFQSRLPSRVSSPRYNQPRTLWIIESTHVDSLTGTNPLQE